MPELREVFEMTTKQVEPDLGSWRDQEKRQHKANRNRKVGGFAVAAAIGVAAVALMLATRDERNTTKPADEPSTVIPVDPRAEEVAMGFLGAFGAFDAETAMTYVADDADLRGLIDPQVPPDSEGLSLMLSLLEAQGYQQTITSCEAGTFGSETNVVCRFDFHAIRSDEIGRGPFTDSNFTFTVREGEIVRASLSWNIGKFSPQMWEPFAGWVSATYPKDFAVMYTGGGTDFRLTEESIRLWERRSRQYAAVESAELVEIAESFMQARNAYDTERALSLLAEDGATVLLMNDNLMDRNMPTVRLDRDELALALEAERLHRVRYESVECRPDPDMLPWAQISCSFRMDNRLRQIQGFLPKEMSFGIGIQDSRVTHLSFPWLNVSFPSNVPAEGWRFIEWLRGEHPEVGAPLEDGTLFRTGGQEMVLILTRDSIDLLADYLDEYERSVG